MLGMAHARGGVPHGRGIILSTSVATTARIRPGTQASKRGQFSGVLDSVSAHWLSHTTLTWVERVYGYGVASPAPATPKAERHRHRRSSVHEKVMLFSSGTYCWKTQQSRSKETHLTAGAWSPPRGGVLMWLVSGVASQRDDHCGRPEPDEGRSSYAREAGVQVVAADKMIRS
jgi:hypothetical protein